MYNDQPTEWTLNDDEEHKGVGLIYPSDYGYASHGGSKGRDFCFAKELYNWNTEEECSSNDWLKPRSITPDSGYSISAFYVDSAGIVGNFATMYGPYVVWPVVYLKSNVKIIDGTGEFNTPFELKLES